MHGLFNEIKTSDMIGKLKSAFTLVSDAEVRSESYVARRLDICRLTCCSS
jgi:hypothetical protein